MELKLEVRDVDMRGSDSDRPSDPRAALTLISTCRGFAVADPSDACAAGDVSTSPMPAEEQQEQQEQQEQEQQDCRVSPKRSVHSLKPNKYPRAGLLGILYPTESWKCPCY